MKMKLFIFLLFGVLIFLFASCGGSEPEETAPESEMGSEVQTTEDGKVLLSSLSDEDFLAYMEENVTSLTESEKTNAYTVKWMRDIVKQVEDGFTHYYYLTGMSPPDLAYEVFDAAKAYYEND